MTDNDPSDAQRAPDQKPPQTPGNLPYPPAPTQSQPVPYGQHPGYGQYPAPYPYANQVAPKNPAISLLVSFFIPGVGSMMNGDSGKGVGILIGYFISLVLTLVLIGIVGVIGFWIWGMVDAYQGAVKWNARHGIVS